MKMKNTNEFLRKQKSLESTSCLERRKLRKFWERKECYETEREIYMVEGRERNFKRQSWRRFSNRDDVKKLSTRFHSRGVSDHVYQQ